MRRTVLGAALAALAVLTLAVAPAWAKLSSKEFKKAQRRLQAAAASNDTAGMISAIEQIAKDGTKKAVDLLVTVGVSLESIDVYDAVRNALQGMREQAAVDHMVKTLGKKKSAKTWQLRAVLLEGLIPHKGKAVTKAMADRLTDKIPYVISAAAKALGQRRDPAAVDALIDALAKLEKRKDVPWIDTKQALTDITGEDFNDSTAWRDYWKVAGPDFDPKKSRGDKEKSTTVVRGDEASQFFKEKIIAKRIMFIIDVSGSMETEDPPIEGSGGGKRVERVKNELMRTIKGLRRDVRFNILAFSDILKSWQKIKQGNHLYPASNGNKAGAVKWISTLKANGMTHTDDALKKAFDLIDVNTIVILSDGAPAKVDKKTQKQMQIDPNDILKKVQGWNRLRGVKIHTFCFEVFKNMQGAEPLLDFMEKLATQNGGKMSLIR